MSMQIVAMGGGGFSMEPDNLALDRYVADLTGKPDPRVCFLAQASGESMEYTLKFYRAFTQLGCRPSDLSLFRPHTNDIAGFLLAQDVIYVGGGNTKSMLALWRAWGLDTTLARAAEQGTVLAGISAGAICWFAQGMTDSIPGTLSALQGLGYLHGSCTPHYDGEAERRPTLHSMLTTGGIQPGYAFDDGAAGHFVDGKLHACVRSRPQAQGYFVEKKSEVVEHALAMTDLPRR